MDDLDVSYCNYAVSCHRWKCLINTICSIV